MKKTHLFRSAGLFAAILLAASCTKQPHHYCPPATHDTVTLTRSVPALKGTWSNTLHYPDMHPSFHGDTMELYGTTYRYFTAADTIYKFYDHNTLEPVFLYTLLDTTHLLLKPLYGPSPTDTFYRK